MLRDFLSNSLAGAAVDDEPIRDALAIVMNTMWGQWKAEDGHCHGTPETWLLALRGLHALVEEPTDASRAALCEWLPSPDELLRIAEYECVYRAFSLGAAHPALLCARLHGEQLGAWKAAAEVAEGVLRIEQFNPLLRTEAYRLLGCARAGSGQKREACEAAECAAAEAAKARYVWLEMASLTDLLKWVDDPSQAEGVRARMRGVSDRMAALGDT